MFLSVVIPVFNVEKQLKKCLDSILRINFHDYEVILVVGESKDRSNDICKQYEEKYDNILIVKQFGKGLSNARNCGLQFIKGKYVTFIDSDDFIVSENLDKVINELREVEKNSKIDIVVSDFYVVNKDCKILKERKQIRNTNKFLSYEYTTTFLNSKESIWNVWRYVYATDFLMKNNRKFKEGFLCEDVDFTIRSFLQTQNIFYFHNPYYCYCVNREGSLFNNIGMNNINDLIEIANVLFGVLDKSESVYVQSISTKLVREIILYIPNIYEVHGVDRRLAIRLYKENLILLKRGKDIKLKIIYYLICSLGIRLVAMMMFVIKRLRRRIIYH